MASKIAHILHLTSHRSFASISFSSSSSSACFFRSFEDSLSTRSSSLSMSCKIFALAIVVLRARRRRAELVLYPARPLRDSSSGGGSGRVLFTFLPVPEGQLRPFKCKKKLDTPICHVHVAIHLGWTYCIAVIVSTHPVFCGWTKGSRIRQRFLPCP